MSSHRQTNEPPEERRSYTRIEGNWPVVILTARGAQVAETRDISPFGAYIFCDNPPAPKEKVRLFIMFPNRRYVDTFAEVAWYYPHGSDVDIPPRGMGIKFMDISEVDREFISSLASGYLESEHEERLME